MILLLAATALTTVAAACPNLDAEVERATGALVSGDFDTATAALHEAEGSFACAPATTSQVARYWLVTGAAAHLRGESAAASAALAAARAAAPALYDERLGPDVRTAWAAAAVPEMGTLLLEPAGPAFVDGAANAEWPFSVSATPHVVQIVDPDGRVHYGRILRINPGEDALVETGVASVMVDVVPVAEAPALTEPKHKKSPALLILAGVAAAGAGACAGGAYAQVDQMQGADTVGALDGAFGRQQALGYSAYGLAGVALVSVGLHIVLP